MHGEARDGCLQLMLLRPSGLSQVRQLRSQVNNTSRMESSFELGFGLRCAATPVLAGPWELRGSDPAHAG